MKKISIIFIVLLIVSLMIFVSGCNANEGSGKENETQHDSVTLAVDQSFSTADPHNTNLEVDRDVFYQVYEPLIYVGGDGIEKNLLAENYEISSDGMTYTFKLRSGVSFHNGEQLTVNDVVFSYERAMASSYYYTYTYMIDSVEAGGDDTFIVHLKFAYAPFIASSSRIVVVNEKFFNNSENNVSITDCGTGPFMIEKFNAMEEVSIVRYDNYWRGAAKLQKVVWKLIPETSTQVTALESGELNLLRVPYSNWKSISESGKYGTFTQETAHISFIIMNTEKEPLNNKLVRQAISYSIDRDNMVNMASDGTAKPAYYMANPEQVSFASTNGMKYEKNVEKARELLKEAGYENGLDIGIIATLSGTYEKLAQVLQANLQEIGIKSTVQVYESSSYVTDVFGGNYTIGLFGGDIGNDADNYSVLYQSSMINTGNLCRCSNPELDNLLISASGEGSKDKRQELYDKANEIISAECYYIPIMNAVDTYAFDKELNFVGGSPRVFAYDWSWK